jgi:XRE family transcriptional regulator, regulator of sulfur utilization
MAKPRLISKLGLAIYETRYRLGMKQHELAEAAGFSEGYICNVENGKRVPTIMALDKIARPLGMNAIQILQATQDPKLGRDLA